MSAKKNSNGIGFLLKIKNRRRKSDSDPLVFFRKLIKTAVDDTCSKIKPINLNTNVEKALITEIKKKTGTFPKNKKKQNNNDENSRSGQTHRVTLRTNKLSDFLSSLPERSIDCIIFCLKSLQNFNEFLKFNTIQYDQLEKAAAYLKYQFVQKGEEIYTKNKRPRKFFGVIQGNVSLRTYNKNLIKKSKRKLNFDIFSNSSEKSNNNSEDADDDESNSEEEEENNDKQIPEDVKIQMQKNNNNFLEIANFTQGMCFGEWDLIKNKYYNETAVATKNTDLFYLEKEYFDKFFSNQISRADIERKIFITKRVPVLSIETLTYNKPEFYKNGRIIYTEFDKATEAILIYKGSAAIGKVKNAKNKKEIFENLDQFKILSRIEKGGIAGLEIGKLPKEGCVNYYDNTLITTDNNTILYRIKINMFSKRNKKLDRKLKKLFYDLYSQQNSFIINLQNLCEESKKRHQELSEDEKTNQTIKKIFSNISNTSKKKESKVFIKNLKINNIDTNKKYRSVFKLQKKPKNINFFQNIQDKEPEKHKELEKQITLNSVINIKISKDKEAILNSIEQTPRLPEEISIKKHRRTKTYNYSKFFKNTDDKKNDNKNKSNSNSSYPIFTAITEKKDKLNLNSRFYQKSERKLKIYDLMKNCFIKDNKKKIYNYQNKYEFLGENPWSDENKKYDKNSLNDIFVFRNKYSYDSGKFKIPLMSLEDLVANENENQNIASFNYEKQKLKKLKLFSNYARLNKKC